MLHLCLQTPVGMHPPYPPLYGGAENAGPENAGPEMQGWKIRK